MSWGSVLGLIGGAIAAPFTGGASLAIGSAIGQAVDARNAEKKGAQQQQQGYQQAANIYAPYNQLGLGAANTLASYLGVPQVEMGQMGAGNVPMEPQAHMPLFAQKMRDRVANAPAPQEHTLQSWLAEHQGPVAAQAQRMFSRPSPTSKSKPTSSYRAAEMN